MVAFVIVPASRAELYEDGSVRLVARRRVLEVKPGDLRSIRALWGDYRRLLPMRVAAREGTIYIHTRMDPAIEALFEVLRYWSPDAFVA